MKIERISVRNLLDRILASDGENTGLRKSLLRALAEPDALIAWEQTLEIMDSMSRSGRIKWLGVSERNGERFLRFQDPQTMDIFSLREPPTVKAEVVPFMPRGFVRKEDSDKIEMLFTSIATCRSEDELGGVLKRMLATVREMLSVDYCVIHFTDESLSPIIDRIADGAPETDKRFAPSMSNKWVRDEGFCLSVPDLRREPELSKYAADGVFASVVVMPLRCKGKTYGVLETWSRFASNFAPDDIGFLSLLAMLVAGMIRNAEHLETLIFRDPLTHVYNRGYLEDQLAREIERYKRANEPVSFLLVDVDNFKQVNTNFGHPVGDQSSTTPCMIVSESLPVAVVVVSTGSRFAGM
jgi:hypothetical protein